MFQTQVLNVMVTQICFNEMRHSFFLFSVPFRILLRHQGLSVAVVLNPNIARMLLACIIELIDLV
jgi:hypothetical protein